VVRVPRFAPVAILLLLSAALLAGCSSAPAGEPAPSTTPPAYRVVGDNRVAEPTTTDVLHLLARPGMTPSAPTAAEPVRQHVSSFFENEVSPTTGFRDTWDYTLGQALDGVSGNATFLVEVTGGLVGDPRADLQGGGCFWLLGMTVGSFETGQLYDLGCVKQRTQVPAGTYTLSFPFTLAQLSLPAGSALHFELHTGENAPRSPGADANVLAAAVGADSFVRLYGLDLPLDGGLVLA
jgi:hypothetical protein